MERGKFQEFSPSSASHSRKFEQDSQKRKFFQKKRTGPPKTKERSAGDCPTLQSASKRRQINLFDIFDAAQVGRQSEGSLAAVEVGFAFADELNHDARQSTYEVVIAGICVCEKGKERFRMERGNFQEFSASSASHSRKFAQDSERRNFFKNCALVRQKQKNIPPYLRRRCD